MDHPLFKLMFGTDIGIAGTLTVVVSIVIICYIGYMLVKKSGEKQ